MSIQPWSRRFLRWPPAIRDQERALLRHCSRPIAILIAIPIAIRWGRGSIAPASAFFPERARRPAPGANQPA